jgi:hypothetical protein
MGIAKIENKLFWRISWFSLAEEHPLFDYTKMTSGF